VLAILGAFKTERAEEFGILELGLFGSIARNADGADSDVDVHIRMRPPDRLAMVHIRDELEARLVEVTEKRQFFDLDFSRGVGTALGGPRDAARRKSLRNCNKAIKL
jgi:predicted nucleotidyltransferase